MKKSKKILFNCGISLGILLPLSFGLSSFLFACAPKQNSEPDHDDKPNNEPDHNTNDQPTPPEPNVPDEPSQPSNPDHHPDNNGNTPEQPSDNEKYPNAIFVQNHQIQLNDVPPINVNNINEQWIKIWICQHKDLFFNSLVSQQIPNDKILKATINNLDVDFFNNLINFEIILDWWNDQHQIQRYSQTFSIENLTIGNNNGEFSQGVQTIAPLALKSSLITPDFSYTIAPVESKLDLHVFTKNAKQQNLTLTLTNDGQAAFNLIDSGFNHPTVSWSLANESTNEYTLHNNVLTNKVSINNLSCNYATLNVQLSEANKKTQAFPIRIYFHLADDSPQQPVADQLTLLPTVFQSAGTVEPKVVVYDQCLDITTFDSAILKVKGYLTNRASDAFDLKNTQFSSNAKVSWKIIDDNDIYNFQIQEVDVNNNGQNIQYLLQSKKAFEDHVGRKTTLAATITENNHTQTVKVTLRSRLGNYNYLNIPKTYDLKLLDYTVENRDYFLKNPVSGNNFDNRITIPSAVSETKNPFIYWTFGNAPLPWVADEKISDTDLYNMFTYLAERKDNSALYFGERKIESSRLASAFFCWIRDKWLDYPFFSFNSPGVEFLNKNADGLIVSEGLINDKANLVDKKWYVAKMSATKFATDWMTNSSYRNDLIKFVLGFMTKLTANMKDIDKFYAAWSYLGNWIRYAQGGPNSVVSNHYGVCIDYAQHLMLLLQIAGVPTVASSCGNDYEGAYLAGENPVYHALTFVYLDPEGGENKQWYTSDPTWSDVQGNEAMSTAIMPKEGSKNAYKNALYSVASDVNHPIDSYQQYFGNQLFGLRWNVIYQPNKQVGTLKPGNFVWSHNSFLLNSGEYANYSAPMFANNQWYTIKKQNDNAATTSFLKGNINSKQATNVIDEIPSPYRERIFSKTAIVPKSNLYNNFACFVVDEIFDTPKLLIVDTSAGWTKGFEKVIEVPLNEVANRQIDDFYLDFDGNLHIASSEYATTIKYPWITIELSNEIKQKLQFSVSNQPSNTYVDAFSNFLRMYAGLYPTGNFNNEITASEKASFITQLKTIFSHPEYSHLAKLQQSWTLFQQFQQLSIKSSSYLKNSFLNSEYAIESNQFQKFGLNFSQIKPYFSINDLVNHRNGGFKYEFYFCEEGTNNFQLLGTKDEPYLTADLLKNHHDFNIKGSLYLKYYPLYHPDQFSITNTTKLVIQPQITTLNLAPSLHLVCNHQSNLSTNYQPQLDGWYNKPVTLCFESPKLPPDTNAHYQLSLKHFDPSQSTIKTIKTINNQSIPSQHSYELGLINDQNHGIYWIEWVVSYSNQTQTMFSPFVYVFNEKDVSNLDYNQWNQIYHLVSN